MTEKAIIYFYYDETLTRWPIKNSFNIPDNVVLPKNITTMKSINFNLNDLNIKKGNYKLIGDFIEHDKEMKLNVNMIIEVVDIDMDIKQTFDS